jgi:multiple sugar transport system substrate-binding protein
MFLKRWSRAAMVFVMAGVLAGCGTGATGYAPAGQSVSGGGPAVVGGDGSGGKVHLVYFNARGAEQVERKLIARYVQEHPNVEIEYLSTTSLGGPSDTDAIANLVFNIQAAREIDVAKIEVSRTPLDLMAANAVQELTAIGGDAVTNRVQGLLNSDYVTINNGVWAVPYEYDPFGYLYNGGQYTAAGLDPDHPPQTWDDLRAVNTTLKAKFPNNWAICHPLKNLAKTMPWVWSAGGDYWDRPILPTTTNFVSPGVVDTYKFIQEWAQKRWLNTDELSDANVLQFMISRKCAAVNYSSDMVLQLENNDPKTDWRVAPFPSEVAGTPGFTYGGGSALVVPSTAAHPKEALDFMLWLSSDDVQRMKWNMSPELGLNPEDVYSQANPASRAVSDQLKADPKWKQSILETPSRPPGISPAFSKIYDILAASQERIIRSNANVEEELRTAQGQSQDLLNAAIVKYPTLYPAN